MLIKNLYTNITVKFNQVFFGARPVVKADEAKIRKFTKHVFKKYDEITVRLSYE